jgi:hypothetical protein
MPLPSQPVTLTTEQLKDLREKLSLLRHDINGDLALIGASLELIRINPQTAERLLATLGKQPAKISKMLGNFVEEFDRTLGITRS